MIKPYIIKLSEKDASEIAVNIHKITTDICNIGGNNCLKPGDLVEITSFHTTAINGFLMPNHKQIVIIPKGTVGLFLRKTDTGFGEVLIEEQVYEVLLSKLIVIC